MDAAKNKKRMLFVSVFGRMGATLAAILSWAVNHSVGWMVLHFLCGWFYVVYYLVLR